MQMLPKQGDTFGTTRGCTTGLCDLTTRLVADQPNSYLLGKPNYVQQACKGAVQNTDHLVTQGQLVQT